MGNRLKISKAALSLPVRGAWVEMERLLKKIRVGLSSLPVRGAWVEIPAPDRKKNPFGSLPVRGAWVEIQEDIACVISLYRRSPCGERGLK